MPFLIAADATASRIARDMIQIIQLPKTTSLGTQFNAFLFASIDEVGSEGPLSVVSVLARLDLDPWEEAANLTALPTETATQRMVLRLVNLPQSSFAHSDPQAIAGRLIALLPRDAGPEIASARPIAGRGGPPHFNLTKVTMFFIAGWAIAIVISGLNGNATSATPNAAFDTHAALINGVHHFGSEMSTGGPVGQRSSKQPS